MLIDRLLFSDRTIPLLKKSMELTGERHMLILSNISNADTPGYKAVDIDFSKQMQEAMGGGDFLNMTTTSHKHIEAGSASGETEVFEEPNAARSNGNNVVMDKEMSKLAENQIMFSAVSQIMVKRTSTLRAAITESTL